MSSRREIAASWLVDCRDVRGNQIKIGASSTRDGTVLPIYPSGHQPELNLQQTFEVIDAFRQAAQDAAQREA